VQAVTAIAAAVIRNVDIFPSKDNANRARRNGSSRDAAV
jgi:hypothetical protein